jgi:hypothetical protein
LIERYFRQRYQMRTLSVPQGFRSGDCGHENQKMLAENIIPTKHPKGSTPTDRSAPSFQHHPLGALRPGWDRGPLERRDAAGTKKGYGDRIAAIP